MRSSEDLQEEALYSRDWQDSMQARRALLPGNERSSWDFSKDEKVSTSFLRPSRRRLPYFTLAVCAILCYVAVHASWQSQTLARTVRQWKPAAVYKETYVWKSRPFPDGHLLKVLDVPADILKHANVTQTNAALHSVVIDEQGKGNPWDAEVRVFFGGWDYPLAEDVHMACAHVLSGDDHLRRFRLRFWPDPSDKTKVVDGEFGYHWTHEMGFRLPEGGLGLPAGRSDLEIPGELTVLVDETVIGVFPFVLGQETRPASHLQICMKPFFGKTDYNKLLEWREHHRLLGFDTVHFSARDASFKSTIDRLNMATGGHDTFRWKPRMEEQTQSKYWDESMLFDECYVTHRRTADWIGVWDMDEFLAPLPKLPWTADWLKDWLAKLDKEVVSIAMPMTWVDRNRFGMIPHSRLTEIDPTLEDEELDGISRLMQNANGAKEWHDVEFYKSLHKTAKQFAADIHLGWPGPPTKTDPLGVVIYHARDDPLFYREDYIHYPLSANIVEFWKRLVHRLREVSVY